jgi:hypothetical protein
MKASPFMAGRKSGTHGVALTNEIRKRLGIKAKPMP